MLSLGDIEAIVYYTTLVEAPVDACERWCAVCWCASVRCAIGTPGLILSVGSGWLGERRKDLLKVSSFRAMHKTGRCEVRASGHTSVNATYIGGPSAFSLQ